MLDSLNSSKNIKVAIVAGEKSGDELGGPLMESLKNHFRFTSLQQIMLWEECID